jgi:peptidoglycan/LPS O-acetylase OafA/YrhL
MNIKSITEVNQLFHANDIIQTLFFPQDFRTLSMQTIGNSSVSVDTFFLMSGLLVSFLLLRELDRNKGKFNVGLYYLHRYLRLTIVYAFILGFIATLIV